MERWHIFNKILKILTHLCNLSHINSSNSFYLRYLHVGFPDQTHKSTSVPFPYSNLNRHKKKSLFLLLPKYFMHFNPSIRKGQTYIWPVSKSSIERLFTGSKQILDIIQTFDFELFRLLFYYFPKIKFQQSNSKSWFDRGYPPSPIFLIFMFSLLPVASVGSYIDIGQ